MLQNGIGGIAVALIDVALIAVALIDVASIAVPEPVTSLLLITAAGVTFGRRRRGVE